MKKCPFCAEEVQDEAIVCKHCGRDIDPDRVAALSARISRSPASNHSTGLAPASQQTSDVPREAVPPIHASNTRKLRTVWRTAIPIGLVAALLAAVPRLLSVSTAYELASEDPSAVLYARGQLQDLVFHFFTNWTIWSLLLALLLTIWRRAKARAAAAILVLISILSAIVYLPEVAGQLSNLRTMASALTPDVRDTVVKGTSTPIHPSSGAMTLTAQRASIGATRTANRAMGNAAATAYYWLNETVWAPWPATLRAACGTPGPVTPGVFPSPYLVCASRHTYDRSLIYATLTAEASASSQAP